MPDPALHPLLPRVGRIVSRRREAPDTWTLEVDSGDAPAAPFLPGQFNMLTAFGVGEIPVSMSGDPSAARLAHTLRAVGPVSQALAGLRPGEPVGVRGPFGAAWPMELLPGGDIVLVAGGLGLAPLRPALYALLARRDRYRRLVLLYGAREPAGILFRRELESWRRRFEIAVEVTVDHAQGDWRGHVGVVPALIPKAAFDPRQTVALVCGPEVMMRFTIAALRDAGLGEAAIYLAMERNMKCAVALCGRCQFSTMLICRDGPVVRYDRLRRWFAVKEL